MSLAAGLNSYFFLGVALMLRRPSHCLLGVAFSLSLLHWLYTDRGGQFQCIMKFTTPVNNAYIINAFRMVFFSSCVLEESARVKLNVPEAL